MPFPFSYWSNYYEGYAGAGPSGTTVRYVPWNGIGGIPVPPYFNGLIPVLTNNTGYNGIMSASFSNNTAYLAADGDSSTLWNPGITIASGTWIQYQFYTPVVANAMIYQSSAAGTGTLYYLEGSHNSTDWTVLLPATNPPNTSSHKYGFVNTTSYLYYRWQFSGNSNILADVATIQLFGY